MRTFIGLDFFWWNLVCHTLNNTCQNLSMNVPSKPCYQLVLFCIQGNLFDPNVIFSPELLGQRSRPCSATDSSLAGHGSMKGANKARPATAGQGRSLSHLYICCEIIYFMGTKFHGLTTMDVFMYTWICGFQILFNITNKSEQIFCWDFKFMDCLTCEIHKIKCPTNKIDFTVLVDE